jgi:type VI protein secretion system component VasK
VPLKNNSFSLAKSGAASTNNVNPKMAAFLDREKDLSRSIYPVGSEKPAVAFTIQATLAPKQDSVTITLDGKTHKYITGPEEKIDFLWPGEEKHGALLKVKYFNVTGELDKEGREWGLFYLLEEGTVTGGRDPFTIKFNLEDQDAGIVTLRIDPQDPEANPFFGTSEREVGFLEVFRHPDLTPPRNVLISGEACE